MGSKVEAAREFGRLTGGSFYIGRMFGPRMADARAAVLSALTGERVPKSRAGWNVFRDAMNVAFSVPSAHVAGMDDSLSILAREVASV